MDLLGQIVGQLFGVVIVGALILALSSRDAVDWDHLVSAYGRDWWPPRMQKRFANMILYSEGRPAKSYAGVIQIGLHDDGVALRPNRLLRPFQRSIFIPYEDIQGWDQGWYLDGKSTELSFRKAPHMRLIMPRDQVEWMLAHAKGTARILDARPPHGTRPWLTYITALAFGVMTLGVIIVILAKGLPIVL